MIRDMEGERLLPKRDNFNFCGRTMISKEKSILMKTLIRIRIFLD